MFPELSVTVHVTIVFPIGNTEGALFVIEVMLQLSDVKGIPSEIPEAVQPELVPLIIAAGQMIIGLILSTTFTNCEQEDEFPASSVTVQTTIVFPKGKTPGALFVTEATWQLSPVIGVPKVIPVAMHPTLVVVKTSGGQLIEGLMLSTIVMVWLHVEIFPAPSVTIQVTVVLPRGNDKGALFVTDATLQLSFEVGAPKGMLVAAQPLFVEATILNGHTIVGLVLSFTVTN